MFTIMFSPKSIKKNSFYIRIELGTKLATEQQY